MKTLGKFALLILGPCAIFQPLAMDIFVSSVPQMMQTLDFSPQKIQYLLIAFMIGSSLPQLIMGKLSDQFGRRPMMLLACIGFCVTSYLCTVTADIYLLTFIRFLHGLTAATSLVLVFAIVRDIANEGQSSVKMYSYISCILALTAMFAPLTGAVLTDIFRNWHATFLFLAVYAGIVFILVNAFLPETRRKVDSQLFFNFLVLKDIFKSKVFLAYVMCSTTTMTGLYLYFSIGSILLMQKLGVSSYAYSIFFGINGGFYMLGNYCSSLLLNRFGITLIVILGNILVFLGASLMLAVNLSMGLNVISIVAFNIIITLGGGLMVGPATSAALESFGDNAGTASGVFGGIQYGLPALIGYFITRGSLGIVNLAGPIILLSLLSFCLLFVVRRQQLSLEVKRTPC